MTLDEAIKHCDEVIEKEDCSKCAKEHEQLKEWLEELKELKNLQPSPERYFKVSKKEKAILKHANKQAILFCSVCGSSTYSICYNFCPRCGSRLRGLTAERRIYE